MASGAAAQNPTEGGPRIWLSASAGPVKYPQLKYLNTANRETSRSATNLRASLEADVGKIGSAGIAVASVDLPIHYVAGAVGSPCVSGCDGTVTATSIMATLYVGGGLGIDQVYQASAGFTRFSDIKGPGPDAVRRRGRTGFTGAVSYGLAWGFSEALSVSVIADIGLVFHEDPSGQALNSSTYYSHFYGVRAGARYGLWSRPR
jgi:hypothetical protein